MWFKCKDETLLNSDFIVKIYIRRIDFEDKFDIKISNYEIACETEDSYGIIKTFHTQLEAEKFMNELQLELNGVKR